MIPNWIVKLLQPARRGWLRRLWYRGLYLRSRHWHETRRKWGRRGYDLHHLRHRLWRERRRDLQLLTRAEHKREHA